MPIESSGDWNADENPTELFLDAVYENILPGSYVIIQKPGEDLTTDTKLKKLKVASAYHNFPRASYGISTKTTRLILDGKWYDSDIPMDTIRGTAVLAQSEELALAEAPILNDEGTGYLDIGGSTIDLDGLHYGIESGRWIIVTGERTDIANAQGIVASELAMVAGVTHDADRDLPGDIPHTTLTLARPLAYTYRRETVTINANVVKATHGETRTETLGSGDGTKPLQRFTLKQSPLTHVSAETERGTSSTLQVRVNDILWSEADSLEGLAPSEPKYVSATDDEGKTTVTFGNGQQGRRLPTGPENVKAMYRTGIGKAGNVKAGSITLLATRPPNVKSVNNPLRASGGADRETRDQARFCTPLVTMALDRLVSVQDYADFARTYAGIGKADARIVMAGTRRLVHLTIAGAGDIPIDHTSDLFRNLETSLGKYGDPYQPVIIGVRDFIALVIAADVKLLPEYSWEKTEPKIRAALLDAFGFEQRELGQNVYLSEVVRVIMSVQGVERCTIKNFQGVSETELLDMMDAEEKEEFPDSVGAKEKLSGNPTASQKPYSPTSRTLHGVHARALRCPAIIAEPARYNTLAEDIEHEVHPAQIAYLVRDVPDVLILNEVKE